MKRTQSLSTLFATLLVGCAPPLELDDADSGAGSASGTGTTGATSGSATNSSGSATDPSGSATDPSGSATDPTASGTWDDGEVSCPTEVYTDVAQIPLSDLEGWIDDAGNIAPEDCWAACQLAGIDGETIGCSVGPVVGGSSSDSGGDGSDGSLPPGGGSTGGGSTGGGSTGGSAGESGSGGQLVSLECEWMDFCLGGRGHAALESDGRARAVDPVGRWAATCAHAEAASVPAFLGLRRELSAHAAPASLVARSTEAAREEVAHARMMARIAARHDARVARPRFGPIVVRDLEAIAVENAVEGCVRETWAALEAAHQAAHAVDPEVRTVMQRIADDEARHAELAQDIDAWCRTRLGPEACARVDMARERAVRQLSSGVGTDAGSDTRTHLGLPTGDRARALLAGLRQQVWN